MRETEGSLTPYSRAISAPDLRPDVTDSAISRRCLSPSLGRRPPIRPSARAWARPALVRSRIMARSNSAKLPTICIIIRPAAVVVSIASVSERKPAPASRSEEHTSELQSLMRISYAVFCLKKKKQQHMIHTVIQTQHTQHQQHTKPSTN